MKKATETKQTNQIIQIRNQQNNFVIISNEIARNKRLTDSAKALYLYLKSHNENFYISIRTIANYLNWSDYKLKYVIKELKQSGFLEIERKGNHFIYKIYDTTANDEYKIKDAIENNYLDFSDIELIYRILNDKKITQELKEQIKDKLDKILHTNIYK